MNRNIRLSDPERRVLAAMATWGYMNKQLADHLGMTEKTVITHLGRIYRKLGVENRLEATTWAWQSGWLESEGRGFLVVDPKAGPQRALGGLPRPALGPLE